MNLKPEADGQDADRTTTEMSAAGTVSLWPGSRATRTLAITGHSRNIPPDKWFAALRERGDQRL
ncbi:hypothetical protein ACTMTI_41500 [Nonomuraea sp. H19]